MSKISAFRRAAAQGLGGAVSVTALALAFQAPLRFGLLIYTEQILAGLLGLALAICFLTRPIGLWARIGIAADWLFAGLGLGVGLYLAMRYPQLAEAYFFNKTEAALIGVVLVPLVLEALRRVTGMALVSVTAVFLLYALFADKIPGQLQGRAMAPVDLVAFVTVDNLAIFGLPLTIIGTVVVVFILFGQLLQATGGANWFTDLATSAVGRFRGGPAKIAIVASGLFGSISGSAVANVASTGIVTIPMMKKAGFPADRAGAYEAVASTGGQIMPPIMGAAAFLMAEFLELSYSEVIAAAIIPALLFYFGVLLMADLEAAKLDTAPLSPDELPKARDVLRIGWYFPLPFAVLVYVLFWQNKGPAEAALWSGMVLVASAAVFGRGAQRMGPRGLLRALTAGGIGAIDVILVGAAAGMIIGVLENTGLSFGLTYVLVSIGQGDMAILLVATAAICIVLGMGMPTTGIYLLVATLAGPPLIELGIDPLAAHLFVLYFGLMSMISPPVAIAAFTAASIAGAGPMKTALSSMRVGWIAFVVPFLFVADPGLLLKGSTSDIAMALVVAVIGIWSVAAGISGYLIGALTSSERLVAVAAGGVLFASRIDGAPSEAMLALGGAAAIVLYLVNRRRSATVVPA
jgi:TRAP transporter 4TM/12TM fusion protein